MRRSRRTGAIVALALTMLAAACGGDADAGGALAADEVVAAADQAGRLRNTDGEVDCVVRLHGRSQKGAPTIVTDRVVEISPTGNGSYGLGHQWLYAESQTFEAGRFIVATEIANAGCDNVVINGFSNGGAFAARLFCDGVSFGGRLRAVVIDDPVADAITNGCMPPSDVEVDVVLFWTGVLEERLPPGTNCADVDFECAGSLIIGIDAMADNLATPVLPSAYEQHRWYRDRARDQGGVRVTVVRSGPAR